MDSGFRRNDGGQVLMFRQVHNSTLARAGMGHLHLSGARGFTLVEVLVVVVIIGVVIGAVSLAISGSGSRELENAARRAELRIHLACERALVSGQDIGFSLIEGALRFGYLRGERWLPVADSADEALRERALGEGITYTLRRDGLPLTADDEEKPQLACYASGELTPFELEFSRAGINEGWRLLAQLDGRLELSRTSHP